MKLGLIGAGKTGSKVTELHPNTAVFNTSRPPTLVELKSCDAIIVFVPGKVFLTYADLILESGKPAVIASTGFSFPKDAHQKLESANATWVHSNNFSIGMNIVRKMLNEFGHLKDLIGGSYSIHDIHHKNKLDAPSGTALSMEAWLGQRASFSSERRDDVVGEHQVTFESDFETVTLSHRAKDRSVFAKGALWCAKTLLDFPPSPGLWDFFDYMEFIKEKNGPQ